MEIEAPFHASQRANAPTPDSLRQRQRDRLIPRGRESKDLRVAATVKEVKNGSNRPVRLSPVPKKASVLASQDRKKAKQSGSREDKIGVRRDKGSRGENALNLTPEVTSAGREGRQFTVANVGNNGRIYLRPTVRPANQRYPQPSFVFPITPPNTAGLETLTARNGGDESQRNSLWTTRSPPATPDKRAVEHIPPPRVPLRGLARLHKRAYSHSTLDEQHVPIQDSDVGAFKVVIERPGTDRPKTAEGPGGIPMLEVPIPSWRLGTPRFSTRGTAFLRGSSYAPTEDMRSSVFSNDRRTSSRDPSTHGRSTLRVDKRATRRHSYASPQPRFLQVDSYDIPETPPLPSPTAFGMRSRVIEPAMFDELTFKPACDDRSLVRYSAQNGGISAATPPRLVAEITSASFLDYDLLSDFFLTYRSFLAPGDLMAMMIARLRWALAKNDEVGMVVRVRTFVALRHWILNYFMDDFVIDYELRKTFCDLINAFVDEILQNPDSEPNRIKILGELKKCWRRTCALYWDGPDFDIGVSQESPIAPGGVAGSRDATLTPEFWDRAPEPGPPRLDNIFDHDNSTNEAYNFFADVSHAGQVDTIKPYVRPESQIKDKMQHEAPQSPTSIMSEEVISCSFPSRSKMAQLGASNLGPHPVPASSNYGTVSPVAYTKSVSSKRRPAHAHKRSASFSDSMRLKEGSTDEPIQHMVYKSTELLMSLPYAGSLVRGNLFPPGQAFVEIIAPSTPAEAMRATTYFQKEVTATKGPSAMSSPGMKKLLGSVRRALGNKLAPASSPSASPTQGAFPNIPPLGVRGATVNRLPGTAIVPQARSRRQGARAPMRIDLLGAGIAEDFKKAVREDAEAEASRNGNSAEGSIGIASGMHDLYPSDNQDGDGSDISFRNRMAISGITGGSKSIVIVDDTFQSNGPIMTGALPVNPSTDTFTDPYMRPAEGLTPPTTPPDQQVGSPRRSSHLLGQTRQRSISLERTPSLVHTLHEPSMTEQSPSLPKQFKGRPSMHSYGRSKRSVSLRRYASYQSGFTRHQTEKSFDATTFSDSADRDSSIPAIAPLHTLRRRPGGDLRAVTNVGDLNNLPLRRTRSIGSIETYSESVRSSYLMGRDSNQYASGTNRDALSGTNHATFSLGALAEPTSKQHASLFSTHSSGPPMRPSFEKEAAKLAQIPDDIDDDGGIESALLKLEGKFDETRRSRHSDLATDIDRPGSSRSLGVEALDSSKHGDDLERRKNRREEMVASTFAQNKPEVYRPQQGTSGIQALKPTVYQPTQLQTSAQAPDSKRSAESYTSLPLLQRDHSFDGATQDMNRNWRETSILSDASEERRMHGEHTPAASTHNSFDFITETASLKRTRKNRSESRNESFLESESDGESDLSSEMSDEAIPGSEHLSKSTFPPMAGAVVNEFAFPGGPLQVPSSPAITMGEALSMGPHPTSPQLFTSQLFLPDKVLPPTPEITPTMDKEGRDQQWDQQPLTPTLSTVQPQASRKTSVHLPFILAFDSQVLAQQFTLVEKDALNEIDWKELIDMRWRNTTTNTRSWVDFLRTQDARGVEVVISRFNIVCKWAVSEIVLTRNLEERVQCIIKFIHIAAHCRAYRNYATLYQLTVALTNTEITRLKTTWSYVPAADRETLKELETLVQPMRNFNNLRAEMESSGADLACIPFIGVYTHDLLFNSQRPSVIASTPTSEPLVNFERCRTSAAIVKNLLRLLEASQVYEFRPIEGITERCLWMAALSDEEIRRLGDEID